MMMMVTEKLYYLPLKREKMKLPASSVSDVPSIWTICTYLSPEMSTSFL